LLLAVFTMTFRTFGDIFAKALMEVAEMVPAVWATVFVDRHDGLLSLKQQSDKQHRKMASKTM